MLLLCSLGWPQNAPPAPLPGAPPSTGPAPQVRVEYFGTERGYTVRMNDVVLLCVVHNVGGVPLPENTLRMHCLPVAGLDYTTGDITPSLPALAPDQSVAFRWRLSPINEDAPMIAAAFVEPANPTPPTSSSDPGAANIAFAVVPRFNAPPGFGAPITGADIAPQAGSGREEAWLASNRVAMRVLTSMRSEPLLLLAGRNGPAWEMVATGLPLARVRTCEDGQIPWWQPFHWRQTRAHADKNEATLALVGTIGSLWRAELLFTAHRDTGAVDGKLRLTARRATRLQAIQLPRLLTSGDDKDPPHRADGTPVLLSAVPAILPDDARVAAAHQGALTYGLSWPAGAGLSGWTWNRMAAGDGDTTVQLGVQCTGPAQGEAMQPGSSVEFAFRLFAFGPSDTVRDALRFALP